MKWNAGNCIQHIFNLPDLKSFALKIYKDNFEDFASQGCSNNSLIPNRSRGFFCSNNPIRSLAERLTSLGNLLASLKINKNKLLSTRTIKKTLAHVIFVDKNENEHILSRAIKVLFDV